MSALDIPTREGLTDLVHGFYADVRADAQLGPLFDRAIGAHWDTHLERMVEFWSTVALGTRSFKGDVFGKHMAVDGVAPEDEALIDSLVAPGHPSTPGYTDPAYPLERRRP